MLLHFLDELNRLREDINKIEELIKTEKASSLEYLDLSCRIESNITNITLFLQKQKQLEPMFNTIRNYYLTSILGINKKD